MPSKVQPLDENEGNDRGRFAKALENADIMQSPPISQPNKKPKEAETWGEVISAWPKTTLCIVSNEFCERFSYYGMRTVLVLYLWNFLGYSQNTASILFNAFTVLCYFSPLLGSILADGYIGKFNTIFSVSILYALGQVVLAAASTQGKGSPLHPYIDILGLIIIALGTGGIKPCVASFGGDQFEPHQLKMISLFFSVFYFSINAGSMISTFTTPIFRAQSCFGQSTCFPLAFGVPAVLMIVAVIFFLVGSPWYKKSPPKDNIFGEVFHLISRALSNRRKARSGSRRNHWLDYYFDTHSCSTDSKCMELRNSHNGATICHKRKFVADVQSLFSILVMFLPVPIFWALYDQQGSRWVIQSIAMDCRLWGDTFLLPDQMQTLNAVLILAFIPLFQVVIYPAIEICFKLTALRKMVGGGVIAALAFVVSGLLQFKVNESLPLNPLAGNGLVSVMNTFETCEFSINVSNQTVYLYPNQTLITDFVVQRNELIELPSGASEWKIDYNKTNCGSIIPNLPIQLSYTIEDGKTHYLAIGNSGALFSNVANDKPTEGKGEFATTVSLALEDFEYNGALALCRKGDETTAEKPCNPASTDDFVLLQFIKDEQERQAYQTSKGPSKLHPSFYTINSTQPGVFVFQLSS